MNRRFCLALLAATLCFAAPYVFFQIRINEAFVGTTDIKNGLRFAKFITYSLAPSAAIIFVSVRFSKPIIRASLIVLSTVGYAVILLAILNFYDYFGIVPHWRHLFGNLEEIRAIGPQISVQLITLADWLILISLGLGAAIAISFLKNGPKILPPTLLILPAIALLGIQLVRHPIGPTLHAYGYTMGCSHYGIVPTYLAMLTDFAPRQPRHVPFPSPKNQPHPPSEKFGIARDANVICLQVESLDASLIGREIGHHPVMPFLEELKESAAYFPHCVAMHAGGGSSDAELAAQLSLVPLQTGSGFTRADWSRITPLSRALKNHTAVAFHANRGSFFERSQRYANMGFTAFHDQKSFTGDAAGWYSRDREFFQQTTEKLLETPQPFFAYLITMQSHGPFRNFHPGYRDDLEKNDTFAELTDLEKNHLATFREVDQSISLFFTRLMKSGFRDNTLVILFGDHESGVVKTDNDVELVPLIIWHPALEPSRDEKRVSQIDIAPTIADLLGIEPDKNWLGTSVFSKNRRLPILDPGAGKNPIVNFSRALLGD